MEVSILISIGVGMVTILTFGYFLFDNMNKPNKVKIDLLQKCVETIAADIKEQNGIRREVLDRLKTLEVIIDEMNRKRR